MAEARRPCWRVSTADQSYERQERDLAAFRRERLHGGRVFRETGSGARVDRAERRRSWPWRRGASDVVLVTELSR